LLEKSRICLRADIQLANPYREETYLFIFVKSEIQHM